MKKKRSAAEWLVILNRLAHALPTDREHHVIVIGGAAMVLGYGAVRMTDDVDVVMTPEVADDVLPVAAAIAPEFDLDADWMNQRAMEAALIVEPRAEKKVFSAGSLVLEAPGIEHMLAMKLTAYRWYKDRGDAKLLLKRMVKRRLAERGGRLDVRRRVCAGGKARSSAIQFAGTLGKDLWTLTRANSLLPFCVEKPSMPGSS